MLLSSVVTGFVSPHRLRVAPALCSPASVVASPRLGLAMRGCCLRASSSSSTIATTSDWELPPSWSAALPDLLTTPALMQLHDAVRAERECHEVLPRAEETLAAFEACAFEDVRVVILGQDPYPTPGHAMGLSFSVRPDVRPLPGSLRNIYKELEADLGLPPSSHGCLQAWADQGVFLLNPALSVRAGAAGSHSSLGWKHLTDAAISALSERREGLVFMLWGKAAQAKAVLVDEATHAVLRAPHPSPLSAHRGFFGCRHFSQANAYLSARGAAPIDWALPPAPAAAAPAQVLPATNPVRTMSRAPPKSKVGGGSGASDAWGAALDAMQRAEEGEAASEAGEGAPQRAAAARSAPPSQPPPLPSAISGPISSKISERLVLVFDTETTGLSTASDRIVQLGAAYWRGTTQLGPPRGMLVDPGVPIPAEASGVHGFDERAVAGAPSFAEVGARFARHLAGEAEPNVGGVPPLLCGYNAIDFDVPLLNAEFQRHGVAAHIEPGLVLDPLVWLRYRRRHWPSRTLGSMAARYKHDLTNAHAASADAAATGAVLSGLLAEGLIPDDVEAALREQAQLREVLEAETARYGMWLYADREDGTLLRLGLGKHVGTPLHEAEPSYLTWVLGLDNLPPAAADAMRKALEGGGSGGGGGGGGGGAAAEVAAVVAAAVAEVEAAAAMQAETTAETMADMAEAKTRAEAETGAVGAAAAKARKASETDGLDTDAEKLAYRMAQGFFSVVETGTGDDWLQAYHPALREAYVVRPGKAGYPYLKNVAGRLQAVGFLLDTTGKVWIRPKVVDGVRSAIDVTTLQERAVPAAPAVLAAPVTQAALPTARDVDSLVDRKTGLPVGYWD